MRSSRHSSPLPTRCPDCCQYCCQARNQQWMRGDRPGRSAQHATNHGQLWTVCPSLWIRRLGVRVPPSAPRSSQLSALRSPARSRHGCHRAAFGRISHSGSIAQAVRVAVHLAVVQMPVQVRGRGDAGRTRGLAPSSAGSPPRSSGARRCAAGRERGNAHPGRVRRRADRHCRHRIRQQARQGPGLAAIQAAVVTTGLAGITTALRAAPLA